MDILTIMLMAVALVCALLGFIVNRANSRNAEALVKMSADKSTAESANFKLFAISWRKLDKNQVDVREFQVETCKTSREPFQRGRITYSGNRRIEFDTREAG